MTSDDRIIAPASRAALFLFYWLAIIQLPQDIPSPRLDPSWASMLSYFAKFDFQFGTDVIFTFGPLGYLYSNFYSGFMFTETILLEVILKAFIAFQLATVSVRAGKFFGILLLLLTLFLSHHTKDYLFHFSIIFALITVCEAQTQRWCALASLIFLAAVSLIKFSFLVMSSIGLFSIIIFYAITRRRELLVFTLGSYVTSFLIVWLAVGQRVTEISHYLVSSLQVAAGYHKSMFHVGDATPLIIGFAILVLSAIVYVGLAIFSDKGPIRFIVAFLCAQSTFLSWKHGFFRAEFYHIVQYYLFSQLSLITAWAVLKPNAARHRKQISIVIAFALALPFAGIALGGAYYWLVLIKPTAWGNLKNNLGSIISFAGYHAQLQEKLVAAKSKYALPKIKARVGRDTIDVFGHEQAIALLNDLNYRPRPVFQSYSAYNEFSVDANQKYYLSDRAPRFILLKLQSIDDRFPAADDSAALETVLYQYNPVLAERGYLLLARSEKTEVVTPRRLADEKTATMNETIELPVLHAPTWIQIDWDTSWNGKLRELAYQPSEVKIEVATQHGVKQTFRLIEPLARAGFLLSPLLFDTYDCLASITDRPVDFVKSFTLRASQHYFQPRFRYRLYAPSDLPKRWAYPNDALRELRYWVFDRAPNRVEAAAAPGITALGESDVFTAPAPSEIAFDVPKAARVLEGSFGMLYLPTFLRKHVDQADFFVELIDRDQKPLELFHRRLIPEINGEDRGKQLFRVALPINNGRQIRLRAIISRSDEVGNKTYWTDVRFK